MRDRLSAIGGTLVIDTAPSRGTRITAAVGV
jgi:signal transduction histidine kinase